MKKEIIYEFKALYRGDFRITGYRFGAGEKSVCIVGNTRGNEYQQLYCCSQLVKKLQQLETEKRIVPGHEILVLPSCNPYSINTKKRFWGIDNTDINRMFPGYDQGETTQRIADGIFKEVQKYTYGIQFCSFYMKGSFVPHVRMMETGYENVELAKEFGLPYVVTRKPRPFDTTTLNYNWQIWETDAFSVYTTNTERVDKQSGAQAVNAILSFMHMQGVIEYEEEPAVVSQVIDDSNLVTVRTHEAGFLDLKVTVGQKVMKGDCLAQILDTYEGYVRSKILAPCSGVVFFASDEYVTYDSTAIFKLIRV